MTEEVRRLFFGMEAIAPWPEELPHGRIIDSAYRHATVAFLGATHFPKLMELLEDFTPPPFHVGAAGMLDKFVFFPLHRRPPRVVAWHANLMDDAPQVEVFQQGFVDWLTVHGFLPTEKQRAWIPHVTVGRAPFTAIEWKKAFEPLPVMFHKLKLYESLGNLRYATRWEYTWKPPFEEIEHTADIAFIVRGENLHQLHHHARIALAVHFPPLLNYLSAIETKETLDEIIIDLNALVSVADAEQGCAFKAVCFHGDVVEEEDGTLRWEMIIDV